MPSDTIDTNFRCISICAVQNWKSSEMAAESKNINNLSVKHHNANIHDKLAIL
jgi:hypothetical protein